MDRNRSSAKKSEPRRAADLLGAVLGAVQTKSSRSKVSRAFQDVVGPRIAGSCEVVGFRNGTLRVAVDSAPLYAELATFRAEEIRLAMNERLVSPKIAKIVFRLDGTAHA